MNRPTAMRALDPTMTNGGADSYAGAAIGRANRAEHRETTRATQEALLLATVMECGRIENGHGTPGPAELRLFDVMRRALAAYHGSKDGGDHHPATVSPEEARQRIAAMQDQQRAPEGGEGEG